MVGRARGRARGRPAEPSAPGGPPPGPPASAAGSSSSSGVSGAVGGRPGPAQGRGAPRPVASTGAIPKATAAQPREEPKRGSPEQEQSMRGQSRHRFVDQAAGDVTKKMGSMDLSSDGNGDGNGNGNGNGKPVGRGGMRGKRNIEQVDVPHTKPDHVSNKQGVKGRKVQLQANYFALTSRTQWIVYQYRVDFSVDEDLTVVKKAWVREHRDRLGGNYLFDGSVLFVSNRLTANPDEVLELISIKKGTDPPVPVQIKLRLVGQLHRGHYMCLQIFNILVRRCLDALKLQLVGRNYFDAMAKVSLRDHNIELWPGYVTSMRQHENQILMVAEITHKVMRTDTVSDLLAECVKSANDYKTAFQTAILGQVVLTDYTNKTYRVDDVVFDQSPSSTFEGKDKTQMTYIQYYQDRYRIKIRDHKQPLLVSRPTARDIRGGRNQHIMLIPELCRLTGLTDNMRSNFKLMSAMAEHTRVNPDKRIEKLLAFNNRLQGEESIRNELQAWNMALSRNLVEFEGRILEEEKILVKGRQYMAGKEADWTRELRSSSMLYNAEFRSFVVIVPGDLRRDTDSFLQALKKSADGMQFSIPRPEIMEISTDRVTDVVSAIENRSSRGLPSLMMFICSNNKGDRYAAIKKKCCVDRPIPSQVVLRKNLTSKGVMSICTKIAIQLNCKLGGAPWSVSIPSKASFMIIGYDVCHDSGNKTRSVGAFVASLNQAMNYWYSSVNFHTNGEELSNHLHMDLSLALRKYMDFNKCLPEKIIVYRDGVGEGQIHYVYNHEVKQITAALTEVYGGDSWKLGYIIVTKRLNTRIFLNARNPPPGTVVDDVITSPEKYDFFLISQSVRQGTVSPTSYNIIYDNLNWSVDVLQALTYKMTHLYYNWSGTVRVPAPCQYAHKLAFLVAQSLHKSPHLDLNSKLYFL